MRDHCFCLRRYTLVAQEVSVQEQVFGTKFDDGGLQFLQALMGTLKGKLVRIKAIAEKMRADATTVCDALQQLSIREDLDPFSEEEDDS